MLPRGMRYAVVRKREREASISSLPNQPQIVPDAQVGGHHAIMGPEECAQRTRLAACEEYNKEIAAKTDMARLEVVKLEALAKTLKVQAEEKTKNDREMKMKKKAEEAQKKDLALLQASRKQRKVAVNNTVTETLSAMQHVGVLSLAEHDRVTQIMQQLGADIAKYGKMLKPEEDPEPKLQEE